MRAMTRFGAVPALRPGSMSGDRRNVGGAARLYAMRAVLACALLSCVVNCSKGASTSSSPIPASPPPTSSTASSSSERKVANAALDQKTVVSRLDSAPAVAPVPSGPNGPGPGAKPSREELALEAEADEVEKSALPPGVAIGKNPTVKSFEIFWKPFRTALLASDMTALAKMTRFPFRALSETDSEPEQAVQRAEFPRLVRRLLAQNTGLDVGEHESHLEYVKRLPRIHEDHLQGPTARVGDLQFAFFAPDGWRFESAYVSDIDESK
jgi:hypothetical protein